MSEIIRLQILKTWCLKFCIIVDHIERKVLKMKGKTNEERKWANRWTALNKHDRMSGKLTTRLVTQPVVTMFDPTKLLLHMNGIEKSNMAPFG